MAADKTREMDMVDLFTYHLVGQMEPNVGIEVEDQGDVLGEYAVERVCHTPAPNGDRYVVEFDDGSKAEVTVRKL